MRRRTLALKKETLVELSTGELDSVAGAASGASCGAMFCPAPQSLKECIASLDNCITGLQCVTNQTRAC